jgi:hypothetical protein
LEASVESAKEWAARVKAENAAKTPEQVAADAAETREWLASLPILPGPPTKPDEVQVIFIRRKTRQE